jgi:hypothetical protein
MDHFDPLASNLSSLVKIAHGKDGSELQLQILEMLLVHMNIECENLNGDLIPMYASDDFLFLIKRT